MRYLLFSLAVLAADAASGYVDNEIEIYAGTPILSWRPSEEKRAGLGMSGPKLDAQWQELNIAFTPEGDGTVFIRFGPRHGVAGDGIPYYYTDIKLNGVPVDTNRWEFRLGEIGKPCGFVAEPGASGEGKTCMRLYPVPDTRCAATLSNIKVTKGEKTELTMQVRCGSILDAYLDRLTTMLVNLDDAMNLAPGLEGKSLRQCLDELRALSETRLHVSIPPLDGAGLAALKAKTLELAKAYRAELARTAGDKFPCLYDQPQVRQELLDKLLQAERLAAALKTDGLLQLMFNGE